MAGGSHNSVAVEFKDFVTVIEGPLSNQRTNAVVAEVHKLFPGKPIRYLVNTHNHFDHLGGVRGFVAEGATVITDDKNRNFYQRVVLAPQSRSLQPDRLSTRPFAPTGPGNLAVQTFTDRYTISDGNQTIELYHVEGLNHILRDVQAGPAVTLPVEIDGVRAVAPGWLTTLGRYHMTRCQWRLVPPRPAGACGRSRPPPRAASWCRPRSPAGRRRLQRPH